MSMPRIATRLNHVAYPTFDTPATVRFYTEVMGFRLVDAVHDESGPKPFLHTFFAMESGEIIAFFDIPGLQKPKRDHLPPWVRHLAMSSSALVISSPSTSIVASFPFAFSFTPGSSPLVNSTPADSRACRTTRPLPVSYVPASAIQPAKLNQRPSGRFLFGTGPVPLNPRLSKN